MAAGKAWAGVGIAKKLRLRIEGSAYAEVFRFETFDAWTKTQLLEPINEMLGLLNVSIQKLDAAIVSIENQIRATNDPVATAPLETQLRRLESQRKSFSSLQDQWKGIGAKLVIGNS